MGDLVHQLAVRLEEVKVGQPGTFHPGDGLEHLIPNCPTESPHRKEYHFHRSIRILVMQAKNLVVDPYSNDQTRISDYAYGFIEHSGEHYGQLVVYYRLNNIVPPESRPRK